MSTSSTSSKISPSTIIPATLSTPTYGKDVQVHLNITLSNSKKFNQACALPCDEKSFAQGVAIQEATDRVHIAAGRSGEAVTAWFKRFLQVREEEAQLGVVWVGFSMISVELAICVVVAASFALKLLRDIGKNLDDVFCEKTFNIVSTGFKAPFLLSNTVLALVKILTAR